MYEALRDTVRKMETLFPEESTAATTTTTTTDELKTAPDLELSIKSDTGKVPVPGGAVHPLTRTTMDSLEHVFKIGDLGPDPSVELTRVIELLESNLEAKSKLYKDVALSSIFLMNNGRYILQKIKASAEIHELVGDAWYRKRSSDLRQYHKTYQRETWGRLLQFLNHDGLTTSPGGKLVKPVLKDRFKGFNSLLEEIHKTQSSWIISDEQLQSELRVSISGVMIPAYRSFLGRFSQYLNPGRQTDKYIKFQPEDIEAYIDDLFHGNPTKSKRNKII